MSESSIPEADAAVQQADATEIRIREQLREQPDDVAALRTLGQICTRKRQFAEARQHLSRLLELEPADLATRLIVAGLAGTEGDLDAAEQGYKDVVARQANVAEAWAGLAKVATQRAQPKQAEEHYRRALKHDPDLVDALLGLGRGRLASGDVEQASKLFQHATVVSPRHPLALLHVAQALIARGEPVAAARPLTRALEIEPEFANARFLLAQIDLRRRREVAAEANFRRVLAGGTHAGSAHAGLGDALRSQGRIDEALTTYETGLTAQADDEALTTAVAACKAELGRSSEAITDLESFIAAHPRCAAPRMLLAEILGSSGNAAQAVAMWRTAAERDPEDLLAQTEAALRLEASGELDSAAALAARTSADTRPQAVLLRARCAVRSHAYATAEQELLALQAKNLPDALLRERFRLLGLVHDHHGRYAEAVLAFREAQRIGAGDLPALAPVQTVRTDLQPLLDDPVLASAAEITPVLLFGLPGSGVERVAALLADQASVFVREDRFAKQTDLFADGADSRMLRSMSEGELKVLQRGYQRSLARAVPSTSVQEQSACVVDWIPCFDARVLAQLRRALPGVRALIVACDPEQAFLDWLAFGWQRNYRVADPAAAAKWWREASAHVELAAEVLPHARIDANAVLADPQAAGHDLAAFLGLDAVIPGARFAQRSTASSGLPVRFAAGHAQHYRDALASAFANLHVPPEGVG